MLCLEDGQLYPNLLHGIAGVHPGCSSPSFPRSLCSSETWTLLTSAGYPLMNGKKTQAPVFPDVALQVQVCSYSPLFGPTFSKRVALATLSYYCRQS